MTEIFSEIYSGNKLGGFNRPNSREKGVIYSTIFIYAGFDVFAGFIYASSCSFDKTTGGNRVFQMKSEDEYNTRARSDDCVDNAHHRTGIIPKERETGLLKIHTTLRCFLKKT